MSSEGWIISGSVVYLLGVRAAICGFLLNVLALVVLSRAMFLDLLVDSYLKSILVVKLISCVHIATQPVIQVGSIVYPLISYEVACGLSTAFVFPIPGVLYTVFVTLISLDCYSEFVKSLRIVQFIRKHRILTVLAVWVIVPGVLIPPAYYCQCWYTGVKGEDGVVRRWYYTEAQEESDMLVRKTMLWVTAVFFNLIPCVITVFCYVRAWRKLRQAESEPGFTLFDHRRKLRVLIVLTGIICLNLVMLIAMEITEVYVDGPGEQPMAIYLQLAFWATVFDAVELSLCVAVLPVLLVMLDPDLKRTVGSLHCCCRKKVSSAEPTNSGEPVRFRSGSREDDQTPLVAAEEIAGVA